MKCSTLVELQLKDSISTIFPDPQKRLAIAEDLHKLFKELSRSTGLNERLERVRTLTLGDCRKSREEKALPEGMRDLHVDDLLDEVRTVRLYPGAEPEEFERLLLSDIETLNRGGYKIEFKDGPIPGMAISKGLLFPPR